MFDNLIEQVSMSGWLHPTLQTMIVSNIPFRVWGCEIYTKYLETAANIVPGTIMEGTFKYS